MNRSTVRASSWISRRSAVSSLVGVLFVLTSVLVNVDGEPAVRGATVGPDFHSLVTLLDGRPVHVVNLTRATEANVDTLVELANNSTVSQMPDKYLASPPPDDGDFDAGDYIVVTSYGLYWLNNQCRGGLLTGMWPLKNTGRSQDPGLMFANIANGFEWAPNELLPGSEGQRMESAEDCPSSPSVIPSVGGEYVLAVPLGGVDASTVCGAGTFAIGPGTNDQPVTGTYDRVRGDMHSFRFTGTLGQEDVGDTARCGGPDRPNFAIEDLRGQCRASAIHSLLRFLGRRRDHHGLQRHVGPEAGGDDNFPPP